jgi:hypothetical protein
MRILMKIRLPVERANALASKGTLGKTIAGILKDLKPEAAYFGEENGQRTGFVVVDIEGAHKIPAIAEPWFLAFNASVSLIPVMTSEDLAKAGPDMEKAGKKYGG